MPEPHAWTTVDVLGLAALPVPVFSRSQNLGARQAFPEHSHRWNQLVYATAGTLTVTVAGARYVITPEQAIWVPTGVRHTTGALSSAEFRNLYIDDAPSLGMPGQCTVYAATPLLRALIVELETMGMRPGEQAYASQLRALVLAQLRRLRAQDFHLPWPASPMLCRICETLLEQPADPRGMEDWGRALGASARTLARRFEREVGMGLRAWRHRLRLFLALQWLCAGRSVTVVALDLGYASPAAFSYMFRQAMGYTPSAWQLQAEMA
jgi:AraC-like DNA-binding protein